MPASLYIQQQHMQLQEKNGINEEFIFRLGEWHIVFAMLKCIGKYIEESGLDRLFVEAGLYGESTLSQILKGKHMKRAMEVHLIMYLALYCVYLRVFKLKQHKLSTETIKSEINLFTDAETKDVFKHYQNNLLSCLAECSQLLSKFDDSLTYQSHFNEII